MNAPINILSLSGRAGASAPGAAAGATAGQAGGAAGGGEFQSLLAVLLDLLGGKTGQALTPGANGEGASGSAAGQQSGQQGLDLAGLVDMTSLLELKAQLAAQSNEARAGSDGDGETPDPLAAVLDLLIGALQNASNTAGSEGVSLNLDSKSGEALKTLNALLATLSGGKPDAAPVPLPSETVDKLKALDTLLAKLGIETSPRANPEIAELKSRIADLLGSVARGDTQKSDSRAPSVAALLGQDTSAPQSPSGNQRDVMAHVLEGARTGLKSDGAGSQTGTSSGGDQAGSQDKTQTLVQQARQDAAPRTTTTGADFAAQLANAGGEAGKKAEPAPDPLSQIGAQSADRAQPAAPRAIPAAYTQAGQRLDVPQIAVQIGRHAANGATRFQIRLDPPEMGRIDVRLDLDRTGSLHARLTVDRPETLDLLQRDARALERALAQSGLDAQKTNLEFSLRQNPFTRQDFGQGQDARQNLADLFGENEHNVTESDSIAPPVTLIRGAARPGGVNLVA